MWAERDHSPAPGDLPFHFVHINREWEAGQKKRGREGRERKTGNEEEGRWEQQRPRERNRGERRAQTGAICMRPMNEIFISDKEETGCFCLLTLALSLSSTWTYSSSIPFLSSLCCTFLSLSITVCLYPPSSPLCSQPPSGGLGTVSLTHIDFLDTSLLEQQNKNVHFSLILLHWIPVRDHWAAERHVHLLSQVSANSK